MTTLLEDSSLPPGWHDSAIHLRVREGDRVVDNRGEEGARTYRLGCMRDMFAGALLYAGSVLGKLDPSSPLHEHLAAFKASTDSVPLHHLASHSTGYLDPGGPLEIEQIVERLAGAQLAFPPGAATDQSRIGTRLLCRVISRSFGRPLQAIAKELILEPAGVHFPHDPHLQDEQLPDPQVSLQEIDKVIRHLLSTAFLDGGLSSTLGQGVGCVKVMTHLYPPLTPVAYGWGFSLFQSGLWGQNGFSSPHFIGARFDLKADFNAVAAVLGPSPKRDLALAQILQTYRPDDAFADKDDDWGFIRDLDVSNLPGTYTGSNDTRLTVTISAQTLTIQSYVGEVSAVTLSATIRGSVLDGDTRWPTRAEFFPHPFSGAPCLTLGSKFYKKAAP